jgi:hypothetical protein
MNLSGLTIDPVTGRVSGVRLKQRRTPKLVKKGAPHLDGLIVDATGKVSGVRQRRTRKRQRIDAALEMKRAWQNALKEIATATAVQAKEQL